MNTILKNIKKNIVIILIIVVGFILLIISGNMLADMGNIKNENPLLAIPNYIENMQWIAFLSAIILTILSIAVWKISSRRKPICISILVLLLLIGAFFGYSQVELSKYLTKNNAVSELPQDISENFPAISLNTFERSLVSDNEGNSVYYIARSDCPECEKFEKSISPFLEKNILGMDTYYTNSDRNGVRSEAMYEILNKYGIGSVPAVIVVNAGETVKLYLDPTTSIDEIKEYLVE